MNISAITINKSEIQLFEEPQFLEGVLLNTFLQGHHNFLLEKVFYSLLSRGLE